MEVREMDDNTSFVLIIAIIAAAVCFVAWLKRKKP